LEGQSEDFRMSEILPAGLQQFVQEELASGHYPSERELVVDAVRTLREARVREDRLRAEIQARLATLDSGKAIQLADDDALRQFLDEIEEEVDREESASPRHGK
jgi:Arc/MetJ-type ribon-helix-helix transcriptional regulator